MYWVCEKLLSAYLSTVNMHATASYIRISVIFRSVRKIEKNGYKLRHVCLSVRPAAWKSSTVTGRISMKFNVWIFLENLSRKWNFHSYLKEYRKFYMKISVRTWQHLAKVSYNEKCCRQNLYRESQHTFCVQQLFHKNRTVYGVMRKILIKPDRP